MPDIPDEFIEFVKMPELEFSAGGLVFSLPKPFKPEIFGNGANYVVISTTISNSQVVLGNLNLISALRNAYIHKIPSRVRIRFDYAEIFDPQSGRLIRSPNPSPQSYHNFWKVIILYYKAQ